MTTVPVSVSAASVRDRTPAQGSIGEFRGCKTAAFAVLIGVSAAVTAPAASAGIMTGNNLWNLRENGEDRFHSNEAYIRPWWSVTDDAVGRYVGNYSYFIPWNEMGTSGDGSGSFAINRGRDHQWSAWTYVYMETAGEVTVSGGGDCVPRVFWDGNFDVETHLPSTRFLSAGVHRIDLTGYNQNDSYNAFFPRPSGITDMDTDPSIPSPSVVGLGAVSAGLLAVRRRRTNG